jgi:hypothetical protein
MTKLLHYGLTALLIGVAGHALEGSSSAAQQTSATSTTEQTRPLSPDAEHWFAHVQYLASDDLKGRLIGTPEYNRAVQYVEEQFKSLGLKPVGTNDYQQRVPFDQVEIDTSKSSFIINNGGESKTLEIGKEVTLSPHADANSTVTAGAVFVIREPLLDRLGCGPEAPRSTTSPSWLRVQ